MRGFVSDDLHGAFNEAHAIAKGTKCQQFLFSLSLNPPPWEQVSTDAFERAADAAEERLGLEGQPRAIVFHEKEGRRHAHVVWSRIDTENMRAINLPHYKRKLTSLSKEIYLEHGWELPEGLRDPNLRDPLNFNRDEWQQALRAGRDPRELKQVFQQAWNRSDSAKAFGAALMENGFIIARGDRRGHVAVDYTGEVYAIAKYTGVRAKEVRGRLGDPAELKSVKDTKTALRDRLTPRLKEFSDRMRQKQAEERRPLKVEARALAKAHADERARLKAGQEQRWQEETAARQARLRPGLKGLLDLVTGKAHAVRAANAREAWEALKRDQAQKDQLITDQMKERRALQVRMDELRKAQIMERAKLDRTIGQVLDMKGRAALTQAEKNRERLKDYQANNPSPRQPKPPDRDHER
ncbi:relaxase/mobilization nuclease domain-containing protein [Hyphobacterium indicum]|uniref:relaxase/mobilization nuclease domain-containing protein n=1 Tax=Hyphobacterium indicum TaxID=2162714 RepID=UPI001F3AF9AF|nr:relaxase/mobilization nuclease domain-containing protein [Hyphobacterium indicum]